MTKKSQCKKIIVNKKRVYIMNKHKINLNDTSCDAFDNKQAPLTGLFSWTTPSNSIDGQNDGSYVASLIANKKTFNHCIRTNLTKFDTYSGMKPCDVEGKLRIKLNTLKIHIANGNGLPLKLYMNFSQIKSLPISEQSKFNIDDKLCDTDIILDPTCGFYGKVKLSYHVMDSCGNVSDKEECAVIYIVPYSHIRVKCIKEDTFCKETKDVKIIIQYTNSYDDNDFDFIDLQDCQHIRSYLHKLTKADIDFTKLTITEFFLNSKPVKCNSLLKFVSTVKNNHTETTPTHVQQINWMDCVTLTYCLAPKYECDDEVYKFNFKVITNTKSISGNSAFVFAKDGSDIEVSVHCNKHNECNSNDSSICESSDTQVVGEKTQFCDDVLMCETLTVKDTIFTNHVDLVGSILSVFGVPVIVGIESESDIYLVESGNIPADPRVASAVIVVVKNVGINDICVFTTDVDEKTMGTIYIPTTTPSCVIVSPGKVRVFIRILFSPNVFEPSAVQFESPSDIISGGSLNTETIDTF